MSELTFELLKTIIPPVITAVVTIIALITSAYSSYKATKTSYSNNIDNMRFTQKEKISDQIIEKSSILLTKSDPNYLNTIINGITPIKISDSEFTGIQNQLLSITDEIQTLSINIKLLSYTIRDINSEKLIYKIYDEMDLIHIEVQDMILQLIQLYLALTPNGNIKNITVMSEKYKLEKDFSEKYPKIYTELSIDIISLVEMLKKNSIPQSKI